jgi:GNAT superfamily N-acetyltransferase
MTPTSRLVRTATSRDAAAMAAVQREATVLAYAGIFDAGAPAPTLERMTTLWTTRLTTPDAWCGVLADASAVVGTIAVLAPAEGGGEAELAGFYVHPSVWGLGAGHALYDAAVQWAASSWDAMTLWVLDGNIRARRYYERRGWTPQRERRQVAPDVYEHRYSLAFGAS